LDFPLWHPNWAANNLLFLDSRKTNTHVLQPSVFHLDLPGNPFILQAFSNISASKKK